jgi:hypothetical protein
MKSKIIALTIIAILGCSGVATAAGIWPTGTNPKTGNPVNNFCDCFQAILDNSLLSFLPAEFSALLLNLTPGNGDVNGHSYVDMRPDPIAFSLQGNTMLDCDIELRLVGDVLGDTAFSLPNGLTYAVVKAAWDQNDAGFSADVGSPPSPHTYWPLLSGLANGLPQILKGFMILGDGNATFSSPEGDPPSYKYVETNVDPTYGGASAGFVQAVLGLLPASYVNNPYIDLANYGRLPQYFAKYGDADGDGVTNYCEFLVYSPNNTNPNLYAANALNPNVKPTQEQIDTLCTAPRLRIIQVSGAGFHLFGTPFALSVTVGSNTGTVSYQWSKNGVPISDATTSSLSFTSPTPSDSGVYSCAATDEAPNSADTGPLAVTVLADGEKLPVATMPGLLVLLGILLAVGGLAIAVRRSRASA